jgi:hypothetical protein
VVAAERSQYRNVVPFLAAIDGLFDGHRALRRQHGAGEFAELFAQFRFGERSLKVATVTFNRATRQRRLP